MARIRNAVTCSNEADVEGACQKQRGWRCEDWTRRNPREPYIMMMMMHEEDEDEDQASGEGSGGWGVPGYTPALSPRPGVILRVAAAGSLAHSVCLSLPSVFSSSPLLPSVTLQVSLQVSSLPRIASPL